MTYMISSGRRLNLVLSHPDASDTSNMSQEGLTQEMLSYFDGWDPAYGVVPFRENPRATDN